jgi:hypothetical protein
MSSQRAIWELALLFSFTILLSRGCIHDMAVDAVTVLLLGCNCSSSAWILYSSFQGTPCAGRYHSITNIEGLLAVGPDMAKVLAVVALRKASLISVNSTLMIIWLYVAAILVYLAVT